MDRKREGKLSSKCISYQIMIIEPSLKPFHFGIEKKVSNSSCYASPFSSYLANIINRVSFLLLSAVCALAGILLFSFSSLLARNRCRLYSVLVSLISILLSSCQLQPRPTHHPPYAIQDDAVHPWVAFGQKNIDQG